MIIGSQPPGPWSQYLKRKDNIGLPLMEVKRKYLAEQLQFDNFQTQQLAVLQGANGSGYPKELKFMYGTFPTENAVAFTHVFTLTRGIKYNGVPIYGNNAEPLGLKIFAWSGNRWEWGTVLEGADVPTTTERVKEILEDNDFTYTSTPTSKRTPKGVYEILEFDGDEIDTTFNHIVLSINDPLPYEIVSL